MGDGSLYPNLFTAPKTDLDSPSAKKLPFLIFFRRSCLHCATNKQSYKSHQSIRQMQQPLQSTGCCLATPTYHPHHQTFPNARMLAHLRHQLVTLYLFFRLMQFPPLLLFWWENTAYRKVVRFSAPRQLCARKYWVMRGSKRFSYVSSEKSRSDTRMSAQRGEDISHCNPILGLELLQLPLFAFGIHPRTHFAGLIIQHH